MFSHLTTLSFAKKAELLYKLRIEREEREARQKAKEDARAQYTTPEFSESLLNQIPTLFNQNKKREFPETSQKEKIIKLEKKQFEIGNLSMNFRNVVTAGIMDSEIEYDNEEFKEDTSFTQQNTLIRKEIVSAIVNDEIIISTNKMLEEARKTLWSKNSDSVDSNDIVRYAIDQLKIKITEYISANKDINDGLPAEESLRKTILQEAVSDGSLLHILANANDEYETMLTIYRANLPQSSNSSSRLS